jgi:oligoendopeptidase F
MLAPLPVDLKEFMDWPWSQIAPYFDELRARPLTAENVAQWLSDWSALARRLSERHQRLYVATAVDTADVAAEDAYIRYLDEIYAKLETAHQGLKEKLIASGLEPAGFEVPLRNLRADADLFRDENLPLLIEEHKLVREQEKIQGAQSVTWEGEELTLVQMLPRFQGKPRETREQMWRLVFNRWLQDRQALNDLWAQMYGLRSQIAATAEKPDFRAYMWQKNHRFDYTPDDCLRFADAIEAAVVPAARRVYARHRARLGVDTLRPWDLGDGWFGRPVESNGHAALKPFADVPDLIDRTGDIFKRVDPTLADYYADMRAAGLLDLENRKNKSPGGFCTDFSYMARPFIFMNAVGVPDDVNTLVHEAGHCFHDFATHPLPFTWQRRTGHEAAELASMSMELLAMPYLVTPDGYYTPEQARVAWLEHLEDVLGSLVHIASVDAFQAWMYTNPAGADRDARDAQWLTLRSRFETGVDWTGLERERVSRWYRQLHIFELPFYYIEYGIAQMGALQVFRNAVRDAGSAVSAYKQFLSLGGTRSLPELYKAAGVKLVFDAATMGELVEFVEERIEALRAGAESPFQGVVPA